MNVLMRMVCYVLQILSVGRLLWLVGALCTDLNVKNALHNCNPNLSAISTVILQTTSTNYSEVCRAFDSYVMCVEPHVDGCKSVLLRKYQMNKEVYSTVPYNCTIPSAQDIFRYHHPTSNMAASPHTHMTTSLIGAFIIYLVARTLLPLEYLGT